MHENDRRVLAASGRTDERAGEPNGAIREVDVLTFLNVDPFGQARGHSPAPRL